MELEGRFTSPQNLADVMRKLAAEHMSGILKIRCSTVSSAFEYFRGRLSGSDRQERPRRLGRILLNKRLIDRPTLNDALSYQADFAPGTPIGRVLVHRGFLSVNDLREAVQLQLEEELAAVLECPDGFYQFEPSEVSPEDAPLIEQDVDELIRLLLGRQDEWERIRQRIPDDSLVPKVVQLTGSSDRELIHLNKDEWSMLSLVNGIHDVGCIASRSPLGTFETYRVINALLTQGLIELKESDEPSPIRFGTDHDDVPGGVPEKSAANAGNSSSSRWSSLLTRLRDDVENSSSDATKLTFDSPVPFLTEICNQVIMKLSANQDFVVDPSDERLAERYWRQVLMSYPRADLIEAHRNLMDPSNFNRYTRTLGVEGAMSSIYLETVEALCRFLRTIYLLSSQRLGTRAARTLFVNVMDDIRRRSNIKNSENFFFKEEVAKILE